MSVITTILLIVIAMLVMLIAILVFGRKTENPLRLEKMFKFGREEIEKIIRPLNDSIAQLDRDSVANKASFEKEIASVNNQTHRLIEKTEDIKNALRNPYVRGRWGEAQLERVLELSGLRKGIDYETQKTIYEEQEDGIKRRRPDIVVNMPENRSIILDSKVSLDKLIDASRTDNEEEKKDAFAKHVTNIEKHVEGLAQKKYHQLLDNTPEFVVMVLPEFALLPAIEHCKRDLLDWALKKNIIIVTPHTLLALLKSIELAWRQTRIAENAQKIAKAGKEFSKSLSFFVGNFKKTRDSLYKAVNCFNTANRSWNDKVIPQVEKFQELHGGKENEIETIADVQITPSNDTRTPDQPLAIS